MAAVSITLNGRPTALADEAPGATLLDALRRHGLTGAKEGCAEGECGACTVLLVSDSRHGTAYRAVNSCLMPLAAVDGHEVRTVEGLAVGDELAPAQAAMAAAGGSQCGYCTPGFVVSLVAEQYRPGRTEACEPTSLAGNLCRCTGYRPIRDAAVSLGDPPPGLLRDRLLHPPPPLLPVSSPTFSRPASVEDCARALLDHAGARLLGGATDLAVESNLHDTRAPHLVSVEGVRELRTFERSSDWIRIGAALPLTDIGEAWADAPAAVQEWLALFASPQIRNRATLGGNLATASPIGDSAPLLLALDARVHLAGPAPDNPRRIERRVVPLSSFFTGYRQTVLGQADLITAIEVPLPLPGRLAFYKVSKRRLDDISTVAAGMALDVGQDGRVVRSRFCFGGVAATPVRLVAAEQVLAGLAWDESAVDTVKRTVTSTLTPLSDHRGSREYRLAVAGRLVEKFFAGQ